MTLVNKQDSNSTDLRYAVETSPGVVDGSAVWRPLEPNSYEDTGGEVTTKARQPINASRQRKKGVVVDLDAKTGFTQDLTPDNSTDLLESFLYAALREKSGRLDVAIVDGTGNDYEPASGGTGYQANDLLYASDFSLAANNGLKLVTGAPVAASVPVTDTGLVTEAGSSGRISRVGVNFTTGLASIDATVSDLPKLKITSNAYAVNILTANASTIGDGDAVTVGGQTYTFETGALDAAGKVDVGASDSDSLDNLIAAINGTGTPGTEYAVGTVTPNAKASAAAGAGDTVNFTAREAGIVGNLIGLSTTIGSATVTGALFAGGVGRDLSYLGLIPGEFVFIGSDETDTSFATAANNGFARVRATAYNEITFDKTQFEMVDDSGTGKTIRMYFGNVLKNESDPTLIVKRSIQVERTLGAPDAALPTEIQAEYVTGSLGDKVSVDMKTADIVTLTYNFMSSRHEKRTGATGVKPGTRPELQDVDAFNCTSDVVFTKMAIVTDGDSAPDPLFSFFTDLQIEINNNVTQNKAVGVLGAFDSTLGFFEVKSSVSAYFVSVAELTAVENNESVTLETHLVKFNRGISIDLPLLVLGKALLDVKINEPIMLPLETDAATAKAIDPDLDYTMLMVFWDFLPSVAE